MLFNKFNKTLNKTSSFVKTLTSIAKYISGHMAFDVHL